MKSLTVSSSAGLFLLSVFLMMPQAMGQTCPDGSYCYYVPPAMPDPVGFSISGDWMLSVPVDNVANVSYRLNGGSEIDTMVTKGTATVIVMSDGEAQGDWETIQTRGGFIVSDVPIIVAARTGRDDDPWQSSSSIKEQALALGQRFRLGGYALEASISSSGGYDSVSVYAPTGAQITFTAPPGEGTDYWQGQTVSSFTISLAAGETYLQRTKIQGETPVCGSYMLDGALVTSSAPITVLVGGRGWDGSCGISGGCGDEGMDNVLPVSRWGQDFVVPNAAASNAEGEWIAVVADEADTIVYIDGSSIAAATIDSGEVYRFQPVNDVHSISTSKPVGVFHNASESRCELGLSFVSPADFPGVQPVMSSFNVSGGGHIYVTIKSPYINSITLNGGAPGGTVYTPSGRSDLRTLSILVGEGDFTIGADADILLGVVSYNSGTGLYGYYNEFRLPGCGDGHTDSVEGCEDGNIITDDGCNQVCQIEVGADYPCDENNDCEAGSYCNLYTNRCVQCLSDANCNDSNVCTEDACSDDVCYNVPRINGAACPAGICYDEGSGVQCVACYDDNTDAAGIDIGCSASANQCLTVGSLTKCGPCISDSQCDDGNDCTIDSCNVGLAYCETAAETLGTSCDGGTGVCNGSLPASCEICLDTDPGIGTDLGCTVAIPFCDRTGINAECVQCRTSADCMPDELCQNRICVVGDLAIDIVSEEVGTLYPEVSGTVSGYPGGTRVYVSVLHEGSNTDTCEAVVDSNLLWHCEIGPLTRSFAYETQAQVSDGIHSHYDASSFIVGACAGAVEQTICTVDTEAGMCRGTIDNMQCCTGCWNGSVCQAGALNSACGNGGELCVACVADAICSSYACACDSGFSGDGTSWCFALEGSSCTSDAKCIAGTVCDTLDSSACEQVDLCGNAHLETGETCDDGALIAGDGCDTQCKREIGQDCSADSDCASDAVCNTLTSLTCMAENTCGNGHLEQTEVCDDGNLAILDGCNDLCLLELGQICVQDSDCSSDGLCDDLGSFTCEAVNTCGNGRIESGEACDDGDVVSGDGCDADCQIEEANNDSCSDDEDCASDFVCDLSGSDECEAINTCGNGHVESGEACDDGDVISGDGCDASCQIESETDDDPEVRVQDSGGCSCSNTASGIPMNAILYLVLLMGMIASRRRSKHFNRY